jgi:hypothetical protein
MRGLINATCIFNMTPIAMILDIHSAFPAGTANLACMPVTVSAQRGASFSSGGLMCRNENKSERS